MKRPLDKMIERQRGLRQHRRVAADGIDHAGGDRHVLGQHRRRARHGHRVEMPVRRGRGRGKVGEFRRPDRIRPEADHVIGQPDRMIAARIVLLDHVEPERQGGAQEGCGLDFHRSSSPGRERPPLFLCSVWRSGICDFASWLVDARKWSARLWPAARSRRAEANIG